MKPESLAESKIWASLLILLGLTIHLVGICQPFLGNFAQHQTDYATVVQRWLETSINPAAPVMRFMGNGQNRLFYGDFPLNITLSALASKILHLPIEISGRGLSALFFLFSLLPFYALCKRLLKNPAAQWAVFFYAFSPLAIIYGQAFLLEMTALSFGVFGYFLFFEWRAEKKSVNLILSAFFLSLMMATRIYYAPAVIPLGLLFFYDKKFTALKTWGIWLWSVLNVAIPLLWQYFAAHTAAAHGDESSLRDNLKVFVFADPIMQKKLMSLDFYFPMIKTVLFKIVTPVGFFLALFGLIKGRGNRAVIFCALFLLSFIPLFIFAPRKFNEFEYYFLPFVPILSLLAGIGAEKIKGGALRLIIIISTLLLAARIAWNPVRTIPHEDRNVLFISQEAAKLIPSNERVIASHGSSTSLLYYLNRDGWPFELPDKIGGVRNLEDTYGTAVERLERYRSQGAKYFILDNLENQSINPAFFEHLRSNYKIIFESPRGLIYSLEQKK